jgi:hypothetical protein
VKHTATAVVSLVLGLATATAGAASFSGGPATYEYGQAFVTVGDPGNRSVRSSDHSGPSAPFMLDGMGRVDYRYRIAQTEFTVGQHVEFAVAYQPYWAADTGSFFSLPEFTGDLFEMQGSQVILDNGTRLGMPSNMSLINAARYVNWLHNGKNPDRWAFETGVYDVANLLVDNGDGTFDLNLDRSADARFWIPTWDEWVKAAHWDPDKTGDQGETGDYWDYANSSDTQPLPGRPNEGGQHNAPLVGDEDGFPMDVGSYADQQSPWGALDMAGGFAEWVMRPLGEGTSFAGTIVEGSDTSSHQIPGLHGGLLGFFDRGDRLDTGVQGFRIAAPIPSPPTAALVMIALGMGTGRRRVN